MLACPHDDDRRRVILRTCVSLRRCASAVGGEREIGMRPARPGDFDRRHVRRQRFVELRDAQDRPIQPLWRKEGR
jgi:hypothetical protein